MRLTADNGRILSRGTICIAPTPWESACESAITGRFLTDFFQTLVS
jgi:hypothetical protein